MQAASASHGARAGTPSEPSRPRLGKRHWQDIRRARALGDDRRLYAVELHGVKMFYRWTVPHDSPLESKGGTAGSPTRTPAKERSANARSEPTAAPKKLNHRQRRSTARLLDYMRTKTGSHEKVAAAASDATNSPTANPRAELSARARGGANASESTPSEPRGGRTAGERACEDNHAFQLYAEWKQQALAGTPASVDSSSPSKRACVSAASEGRQIAPGSTDSDSEELSAASSLSTGHSSPMSSGGRSDQFQRASAGGLLPIPRQQRDRPRKGNGRGGSRKGGKGRSRHR